MSNLYILGVQAQNFKKIKCLNMKFSGENLVQITGVNGAGKSSALDAIITALAGKRVVDSQPIRAGETKGWVRLDLGNGEEIKFIIERSITDKGMYLTLKGAYDGTPQEFLDKLVSGLSFDPMEFARIDARKQADIILEFAGVKNRLAEINSEINNLKMDRRDNDRDLRAEKSRLEPNKSILTDPDIPDNEINMQSLLSDFSTKSAELLRLKHLRNAIEREENQIRESQERILQFQQEFNDSSLEQLQSDVEIFQEQIGKSETLNRKITQKAAARDIEKSVIYLETQSQSFNSKINSAEKEKGKLLEGIYFPIEGLKISEENGLLFNGIPFDQIATSEKMKIATALGMLLNPELKTIIIRDGNDLDDEGVKKILSYAQAKKYQVIMERIYKADEVGLIFEIENGEIKSN